MITLVGSGKLLSAAALAAGVTICGAGDVAGVDVRLASVTP